LWIRFPDGRRPGVSTVDWTSLVDIYPTIASELDLETDPRQAGLPLGSDSLSGRPQPAIAVADGVFTPEQYSSVGDRCRWSASVAAYDRDLKVVVDSTVAQPAVFDLEKDPDERSDLGRSSDGRADRLAEQAWGVLRAIEAPLAKTILSVEVDRRLSSWGYLA
jgi:arylsulfatase A-like enzyme